jgi:hypothetical protein
MSWRTLAMALTVAVGVSAAAVAGEEAVTLTGKVVCAKCTLKKADAKECHNVLVVQEHGHDVEYYITKNKVDEKFGEVCTGVQKVIAVGTVEEKEERRWLTASKIEKTIGSASNGATTPIVNVTRSIGSRRRTT